MSHLDVLVLRPAALPLEGEYQIMIPGFSFDDRAFLVFAFLLCGVVWWLIRPPRAQTALKAPAAAQ